MSKKKYYLLISAGYVYVWCVAILSWMDWIKSDLIGHQLVGYVGMAMVSASMVAIGFYLNDVEERKNKIEDQCNSYKQQMEYWEGQSKIAIGFLEKERKEKG